MKTKQFILLFAIFTVVCTNLTIAQYGNSTLNGYWLFHTIPLSRNNLMYLGFDGNGNIIDFSIFGKPIGTYGTYSVSASGAITGTIYSPSAVSFIGQLSSQNYSTLNVTGLGDLGLTRIMNPGGLTYSLSGVLNSSDCGEQKHVNLEINNQGQIISAQGLTEPVTGRIFTESGLFVGNIYTGATDVWNELIIRGIFNYDFLCGILTLDAGDRCIGTAQFEKATKTGIETMQDSISDITLHPNPTYSKLTLKLENYEPNKFSYLIYDVNGKTLISDLLKEKETSIETSGLNSSIYFLKVIKNNEEVKTFKIIKN